MWKKHCLGIVEGLVTGGSFAPLGPFGAGAGQTLIGFFLGLEARLLGRDGLQDLHGEGVLAGRLDDEDFHGVFVEGGLRLVRLLP